LKQDVGEEGGMFWCYPVVLFVLSSSGVFCCHFRPASHKETQERKLAGLENLMRSILLQHSRSIEMEYKA
jgi:hypothetical protein